MEIKKIGVHHFAGDLTLAQLNAEHKRRWPDFPSRLRPDLYVGYTIVIWKDGTWLQTRFIGEETAAAKGANFEAVHIALNGNFSVSMPTTAQIQTLKKILTNLVTKDLAEFKVFAGTSVNVKTTDILPHRRMGTTDTQCFGTKLPDDWAKFLVVPVVTADSPKPLPEVSEGPELSRLQKTIEVLKKLIESYILMNKIKLGGVYNSCEESMRG